MTQTQTQMQAMRHRYRTLIIKQARMIRVQWLVILCLTVALVISICAETSVKAAVGPDTPGVIMATMEALEAKDFESVYIPAPEPVEEPKPTEPTPTKVCLGQFKLTAYCACKTCCDKDPDDPAYRITRSGTYATVDRTIAVDPDIIPLGTEVIINGHTYIAEDTGSAINDKVIDIFFDDHQDALNFGVQYADVYINQY